MGQKVSPVGLRIGINKDWEAKWFAGNKDFSKFLEYIMDYAWDKLDHNEDLYIDWLTTSPGFNDRI